MEETNWKRYAFFNQDLPKYSVYSTDVDTLQGLNELPSWLDKARLAAYKMAGLIRAYLFVPNMIQIALVITNVLHDIKGDKAIREYPNSTLPAMLNKQLITLLVK